MLRVALRIGRRRGTIRLRAEADAWRGAVDGPAAAPLGLTLAVGDARFCAHFEPADIRARGAVIAAVADGGPPACPCPLTFGGTWTAIQRTILDWNGCTHPVCHGAEPGAGGLDLRSETAYENLIGVASALEAGLLRVRPGSAAESLLWLKLTVGTPGRGGIFGSPMPLGGPLLPWNQAEAIRAWIDAGAPESGTVPGSAALLGVCLPHE